MLLCLGAPEVFQLPISGRNGHFTHVNGTGSPKGSSTVESDTPVSVNDTVITVCTSICERYLFVLTTYALYVYSNIGPNVCVGHFELDHDMRAKYGRFRGIALVPELPCLCLLLEKRDKVLICTYDTRQLGAYADYTGQTNFTSDGTTQNVKSVTQRGNSGSYPAIMATQRSFSDICKCSSGHHAKNIRHLRMQYEELMVSIQIKMLFILSLPVPVKHVTFVDGQIYFWAAGQLGVYATICDGGFTNYFFHKTHGGAGSIQLSLNVHGTNLIKNMVVSGSVSPCLGLCYLSFTDTLYTKIDETTPGQADLYVLESTHDGGANSLIQWVESCCANQDSEEVTIESDGFDTNRISADSLLTDIESSVSLPICPLEDIINTLSLRQVIMAVGSSICLIVTEGGALLVLHVKSSNTEHIGQLVYKEGVTHISAAGNNIVVVVDGNIVAGLWQDSGFVSLWSYRLDNVRGLAIHNNIIAAVYNHDGFYCFNTLGKVLLHRRSKVESRETISPYFAVRGLALITTHGSTFVKYNLHAEVPNVVAYSNPCNNTIAFVGDEELLLFNTRMLDGTFGIPSKGFAEDRNRHAYDNNDLIGDFDCALHTIRYKCLEPQSGRWPIINAIPSPNGYHVLCSSPSAFAIYDKTWLWFGERLGESVGMGWLNDDICFVFVALTTEIILANRSLDNQGHQGAFTDLSACGLSYCHFFHVNDLSTQIETLPLKSQPLCCTVYNETLYILDGTQRITGYQLVYDNGACKFDQVTQIDCNIEKCGQIREIHCLDDGIFALMDHMGKLYRITQSGVTKIMDGCSFIIPSVYTIGGHETVLLLCSVRFEERLIMVTAQGHSYIQAHIPSTALVNQGIVAYLVNVVDTDDKVQKVRVAKMPLPVDDLVGTVLTPFQVDILDKLLSNATHAGGDAETRFMHFYSGLSSDMQRRLIARHSRRHYIKEDIDKLESLFGCNLRSVFSSMLGDRRASEASFMLLGLQSITGPDEVRNTYNKQLLQLVAKNIAIERSRDDTVHLFDSLLRFQNIVESVDGLDLKQLVLSLLRECNLMGVYKLLQQLCIEPLSLVESIRSDLSTMYVWGICGSQPCRCSEEAGTTVEGHEPAYLSPSETASKHVDVARMIIALRMQLALTGEADIWYLHKASGSTKVRLSQKIVPYAGTTMCSYFYDIFIAQRLFIPAAAIAIACGNFVALSQIILMDNDTSEVVRRVLAEESYCQCCVDRFHLIKHCLMATRTSFTS
ncbi:prephenate dehydrogenase, putative [Babesia ovis]|uniref:Prephenate dehydrogenase, putative n=1 Tax=Babesia ovis TaxID=5869 RepID=A0A9W5TDH4_BABOV|nr:prephenate dehydrogenase, putative [Babesia ovis]